MKVQGQLTLTRTQTLKGSVSKDELLAFVRETVAVPSHAMARFYVVATGDYLTHRVMQQMAPVMSPLVDVDKDHPLHFVIEWSLPIGPSEQG